MLDAGSLLALGDAELLVILPGVIVSPVEDRSEEASIDRTLIQHD